MAITLQDIKNLAELARMDISVAEAEKLTKEVDYILNYVGQIENAITEIGDKRFVPKLINVMRDDIVTNKPEEYTETLLKNSPSREGNYFKVKKILG